MRSRRRSRSTRTTSAAWSPVRAGRKPGVWVIAETTELPTKYAKIVVTDDQGRYVIPDLPNANYQVWVRGFGLVDSPKARAKPGQQLNLTAVPAPNERAAAQYYPAIYWYAMMKMPPEKDFGGSTEIPKNITRETWRQRMGNVDCIGCHQLGQESTRTVPAQFGEFKTGADAWMRRISSGQTGEFMTNRIAGQLSGVPFKYFGEWTDRVAKGELPKSKPPRPQGVERNIVVTSWEWGTEKTFIHDLISSDRRHPTVNAYGPLYGSNEYSSDDMPILDPKTHKVTFFKMSVADPERTRIVRASVPCLRRARSRRSPRPTGATRKSGTSAPTTTTACSTRAAGCGLRRRCAGSTIQPSARRARTIPRPRCSRSSSRGARCRCSIPRR